MELQPVKPERPAKWSDEVRIARKEQKDWEERTKKIIKRYRDEDRSTATGSVKRTRMNLLWSNIQTLGPTLYARTPKAVIERRWKDQSPLGRVAAQILERCTTFSIDSYDFDQLMRSVRDDYLLAGRGTAWVRYIPTTDELGNVVYEEVTCDYVHWCDFLHSPAKNWNEVRWVGRRIYLTRKELLNRFGDDVGGIVKLDFSGKDSEQDSRNTSNQEEFTQAKVWEIWDKVSGKVIWFAESTPHIILDEMEPPLRLKGFFPTPKPLYATTTTDTLIPVPDFALYQDQAAELDELTARIEVLTEAVRVCGVFPADFGEIELMLKGSDNKLTPIRNWPQFQQQGGLKGVVDFLPFDTVVNAIKTLYDVRSQVKADLYEITGIADVIRGNSSPNETATAQQIKGQFATLRLADRQREVQRYARDLIALKAEIIAEHFSEETMALMAGVDDMGPEPQQRFSEAVGLLRNDLLRAYKIDIETDSTIAIDENLDKQRRVEFVQTVTGFMEGAVKASQAAPFLAPLMAESLLFLARGYAGGRQLEASIEAAMGSLVQQAQQAMQTPPPQDPNAIKAQAGAQKEQQKMQMEMSKFQADMQMKQAEMQAALQKVAAELQLKREEMAANYQLQQQKLMQDADLKSKDIEAQMVMKHADFVAQDILQTKKDLIATRNAGSIVKADGTVIDRPKIRKFGKFSTDPLTGERTIEVIEEPITDEEEDAIEPSEDEAIDPGLVMALAE